MIPNNPFLSNFCFSFRSFSKYFSNFLFLFRGSKAQVFSDRRPFVYSLVTCFGDCFFSFFPLTQRNSVALGDVQAV